jgi:hypothetical protein
MTPEEKKAKQHAAWKKWYDSPKGQAYRDSKRKIKPAPVICEGCTNDVCKTSGCTGA